MSSPHPFTTPLTTIVEWLAGEFDNQAQALEQPAWFVHLRLWHRLLPIPLQGHPALFAEQANAVYLDRPYRQRVFVLKETADSQILEAQYFAFKQPDRWLGAGAHPDKLTALNAEDLELLPGCALTVRMQPQTFRAEPEPGAKCCFQYEGQTRQVVLGFEVSSEKFISYDRGVDPDTGAALWGATMGGYEFRKRQEYL